ncbi:MAG: hypothetical protein U1F43_39110, partial [Myxococcota bacterium]
ASAFQRGVAHDRNATAAYSGLARAYGKLGRAAESAWASRKAAELAALPAQSGYRVPNEKTALTTSSALKPWKQYTFTGPNLIDDNLWTSWQPNRTAKGGVGEWIKMTFTEPQTLTGFEFSNGFRRLDDLGDLYTMNNRIENATVELSDGTKLPIHFDDVPREATIMLPESKTVTWVKLTVDSVFKGTEWNDLAVSEFHALAKEE